MKKFPKTPSFNLSGKRALVTGASSGIGLGCAIAFAEKGAKVTLASRNMEALSEYIIISNQTVGTLRFYRLT